MNLQEAIKSREQEIERCNKLIVSLKMELKSLVTKRQPDSIELYNGIEKLFTFTEKVDKYEFILGGDGRSQPWSETREGKVIQVTLNDDIYLDSKQRKIIEKYIKDVYNPDHIEFYN